GKSKPKRKRRLRRRRGKKRSKEKRRRRRRKKRRKSRVGACSRRLVFVYCCYDLIACCIYRQWCLFGRIETIISFWIQSMLRRHHYFCSAQCSLCAINYFFPFCNNVPNMKRFTLTEIDVSLCARLL